MLSRTCVVVWIMTDNEMPNAVAVRHAQYVCRILAGVIFVKNIFKKIKLCSYHTFCEFEIQDYYDRSIFHMHVYS